MLDFKQEVIDNAFGQGGAAIGFKSDHNEVTIPAIHFIESSAGNDVGVGQIEQARGVQFFRTHIAEFFNATRQRDHANMTLLCEVG